MPIITIDGWKGLTPEQKKQWVKELTEEAIQILGVPYDEVVIYIRDIERDSWGQAGIMGTSENWLIDSRVKYK